MGHRRGACRLTTVRGRAGSRGGAEGWGGRGDRRWKEVGRGARTARPGGACFLPGPLSRPWTRSLVLWFPSLRPRQDSPTLSICPVQSRPEPLCVAPCCFLRVRDAWKRWVHTVHGAGAQTPPSCAALGGGCIVRTLFYNSCLHCKVRKTNFSLERFSNVDTCVIVYFCLSSFLSCSVAVIYKISRSTT